MRALLLSTWRAGTVLLIASLGLAGSHRAAEAQDVALVEGRVVQAASGAPIPGASVRLAGTRRGRVTDSTGRFTLEVARFPAVLAVSHVSHQPTRVTVEAAPAGTLRIRLAPRIYERDDVVVGSENPGRSLMRSVIAQKKRWQPRLRTRAATDYSRLVLERLGALGQEGVLRRDGRIMLVSETAAHAYWRRADGPRTVVYTRRRSGDFYRRLPVHAAGHVPNLYADAPVLQGLAMMGPTHPDALQQYAFTLARRRIVEGRTVYDIDLGPRDAGANTFVGTVSILDKPRVIVRAQLRPAPHVDFPLPTRRWDVGYTQLFAPVSLPDPSAVEVRPSGKTPNFTDQRPSSYREREERAQQCGALDVAGVLARLDSSALRQGLAGRASPSREHAWLPRQLRASGTFRMRSSTGHVRTLGMSRLVCRTEHRINGSLPAAPFAQNRPVIVDHEALRRNRFAVEGEALARLPAREQSALERLQARDLTLPAAFPAEEEGALAFLLNEEADPEATQFVWPKVLGYEPRLRYNRVDGSLAGIGNEWALSSKLKARGALAMATGLRRIRYHAGLEYRPTERLQFRARYRRDTAPRQRSSLYSMATASLPARLGGADYFDYYWQEGGAGTIAYDAAGLRLSVGARAEKHASLERQHARARPFEHAFRANPAIDDGTLYAATAALIAGRAFRPFRRLAALPSQNTRLGLHVEHSSTALFGSDFDFTRFRLQFDGTWPTFFRRRAAPNQLHARLLGSLSLGTPPTQRFSALDGSLGGCTAFGALRSLGGRPLEGPHALGLFWEHDFGSVPFKALGLRPLADLGMGIAVRGGHGRTWLGGERRANLPFAPRTRDHFVHELGLSVTRVGGMPLRLGTTFRVDAPGVFLEFGLSY